MATPEGKIKIKINKVLGSYDRVWYFMPVPSGFGKRTVDYIGCVDGRFFVIEAKRPGSTPTPLQLATLEQVNKAGGATFVINSDQGIDILCEWIERVLVSD